MPIVVVLSWIIFNLFYKTSLMVNNYYKLKYLLQEKNVAGSILGWVDKMLSKS